MIPDTMPASPGQPSLQQASDLTWRARGDELPEARMVAELLDADHAPDSGGLQQIGTCRTCGLIIARDGEGPWTHRPSVGEIDPAKAWLNRQHAGQVTVPTETGAGHG